MSFTNRHFAIRRAYRGMALAALAAGAAVCAPLIAAPDDYMQTRIHATDGGWDYVSVDPVTHDVYIARGTGVTVIQPSAGSAREIGTIAKAHAVVPISGTGMLLVTSGHDDSVRLLDVRSGREVGRIAVGSDPDAAFFDAPLNRAIIVNAKAGTVSIIAMASHKIARTITLKPGLEFAVKGPGQTLFVNNEDANEIEAAGLATGKVDAPIALPGCTGPTGLAYDPRRAILISACANGKAAVVDVRTRKLVTLLAIGDGPDAVILDEARRTAFIPCGKSSVLDVIALDAPGGPHVVRAIPTELGARTGAIDAASGTIYLPTTRLAQPTAPAERPTAVPGMFHVLVLTPKR